MRNHWIIGLALVAIACGCNQEAERTAQDAQQDARVAEALKKQKRGAFAKPEEVVPDNDIAAKTPEDEIESTETGAKLNAQKVLDDAIATAKSEDKALFVHFTADW